MTKEACPEKAIEVELKVFMYCKACERAVFNTLCKLKGVEKVWTDMDGHKAVVMGRIEPQKLLKKLKKKTGKRAEIVANSSQNGKGGDGEGTTVVEDGGGSAKHGALERHYVVLDDYGEGFVLDLDFFSDENPNACSVM